MESEKERIIKKFEHLSNKYHKLSLLFYELSRSLNIELKPIEHSRKEIRKYLKDKLNLDYDKLILLSADIKLLSMKDIKKGEEKY